MFTPAQHAVDFDRVLKLMADFASCSLGAQALLALRPETDAGVVRVRYARAAAALALLDAGGEAGAAGLTDDREGLESLRPPFSFLDGPEFVALAANLERLARLRGALLQAPEPLRGEASHAFDCKPLALAVQKILGADGIVRDDASPELRRLRKARARIAREIEGKLQSALKSHANELNEALLVERNGRLVLSVKSMHRRAVAGIVHGLSGSGQTVFIEPAAAVELNNEGESLHADELLEIRRLLTALGDEFRAALSPLRDLYALAGEWDALLAAGRFARACDARLIAPPTDAAIDSAPASIRAGRHPLLDPRLRDARERTGLGGGGPASVIPISLEITGDRPVLLISGPNAGGKTAALKLLGLFAMLHQCGLPVPAEAGTGFPLFRRFHTDIGEDQSLLTSLSTFSARMTHLAETLADLPHPSLVLLDELGTGTDPDEGTALAKAALEKLAEAGAYTAATTHFDELKAFSLAHPKLRCAAAQFDESTLAPLYRLDFDHPGRSYGLAVASRSGVPEPVVSRARELLGKEHQALAELLRGLEARIAEAEAVQQALRAQAADQARAHGEKLAALNAEFSALRADYDKLLDEALASGAKKSEVMRKTGEKKAGLEKRAQAAGLHKPAPPPREFKAGDRVKDRRFGVEGIVIGAKGKVISVRAGAMKMDCAPGDLEFLNSGVVPGILPEYRISEATAPRPGTREINLLGKYVEEALDELATFLDQALRQGSRSVRVVHGHGTGRLKQAVRKYLQDSDSVVSHAPAPDNEGGDGATIVMLDV